MDLSSEIQLLDDRLLAPVTTVFPAPLTDEEKISVNAFLVLSHACVEEHIEETFSRHALKLASMMTAPRLTSDVARAALAFGLHSTARVTKAHPYAGRELGAFAVAAAEAYEAQIVRENHGVKSKNVKLLAEGIGVSWPEFDANLNSGLADLSNLGSRRGEAGHLAPLTSRATKVTHRVDPDDVRRWVHAGRDAAIAIREELANRLERQADLSRRWTTSGRVYRAAGLSL